ncbi:MAG: hypothetical protein WC151_08620, partial [Bacteroidales bacterium]
GFRHRMDEQDYTPFVVIGEALGIRLQGAFILAEMDRLNVCAQYPTTTREKENWDNSDKISIHQIRSMDYIVKNSAYLEFALHGVGHEYWPEDGIRKRAEWYNIQDDHPWPEEEIHGHIQCYKEILAQYGIDEKNGHSFPESFVPCAYSYYWNPSGNPYSLGKILRQNGVKYANTLLQEVSELNPPIEEGGGVDNGVLVIDRHNYDNYWFEPASLPKKDLSAIKTNFIEAHWANLIATDDSFQDDLNARWIEYFKNIQAQPNWYLAKNTEQFNAQWLYKKYTIIQEENPGSVYIDNRAMPQWAYLHDFVKNMVLKIKNPQNALVQEATVDGVVIPAFFNDQGYTYFYLPPLENKEYTFIYRFGNREQNYSADLNKATFNLYRIEKKNKKDTRYHVRVYGSQQMEIRLDHAPIQVTSSNENLEITEWKYENGKVIIALSAHDFQGENAEITITH